MLGLNEKTNTASKYNSSAPGAKVDWAAANAYTLAYNNNRGKVGKYQQLRQEEKAKLVDVKQAVEKDLSPPDFPAPKNAADMYTSPAWEAPPGEFHEEADYMGDDETDDTASAYSGSSGNSGKSAKNKGGRQGKVDWVAANAYTKQDNVEKGRLRLQKGDGAERYAADGVTAIAGAPKKESALPPIEQVLPELSPADFPLQEEWNLKDSERVERGSAAPGEPVKNDAKPAVPWADANAFVWSKNAEAGRANKLPGYVMRAWQSDNAEVIAAA